MFAIDFYIQIVRLLPPFLRKPKMIAWLYRLSVPIINLYSVFLGFRTDTLMRLSVNGQTIALEWILNQLFDPSGNGIYIETNTIGLTNNFIFSETNNASPNYVYSETDTGAAPNYIFSEIDFINITHFTVYIPLALSYDAAMLSAIVEYYRLAGKNWSIQSY